MSKREALGEWVITDVTKKTWHWKAMQQYAALAEHLGCKPEDLNVDLVALVEAAKLADDSLERMRAALWDSHYGRGIAKEYVQSRTAYASNAQAHLRQALTQFDTADKE